MIVKCPRCGTVRQLTKGIHSVAICNNIADDQRCTRSLTRRHEVSWGSTAQDWS